MRNRRWLFWLIVLLTLTSFFLDLPRIISLHFAVPLRLVGRNDIRVDQDLVLPVIEFQAGRFAVFRDLEIKKGIDLAGGTHLVFQAEMADIAKGDRPAALEATRNNIERRVNLFGVAEPLIQTAQVGEEFRLVVELPGIKDINTAISLIGQTAQLDFRQLAPEATAAAALSDFKETGLTGKDLAISRVDFDPNTGSPIVGLKFNSEGAKRFADITSRNVGKPVAIFLDQLPITIPLVKEPITSGDAVISGEFTVEEAKKLSIQLNAGALPVPIKIIEQRNIGAFLGEQSIQKSIRAGLIGLLMVAFFMGTYYGRLGVLADLGLLIYGLITLALYKLIPVILTLPGVAGFILSMGMAVDANILIFERMKEELRVGKPRLMAMELGFGRAWDSIRDANVCTLITCFILFNPFNWPFLNNSGLVRGFAFTLGLGVLLSLFTGIVVTRTILRTFTK